MRLRQQTLTQLYPRPAADESGDGAAAADAGFARWLRGLEARRGGGRDEIPDSEGEEEGDLLVMADDDDDDDDNDDKEADGCADALVIADSDADKDEFPGERYCGSEFPVLADDKDEDGGAGSLVIADSDADADEHGGEEHRSSDYLVIANSDDDEDKHPREHGHSTDLLVIANSDDDKDAHRGTAPLVIADSDDDDDDDEHLGDQHHGSHALVMASSDDDRGELLGEHHRRSTAPLVTADSDSDEHLGDEHHGTHALVITNPDDDDNDSLRTTTTTSSSSSGPSPPSQRLPLALLQSFPPYSPVSDLLLPVTPQLEAALLAGRAPVLGPGLPAPALRLWLLAGRPGRLRLVACLAPPGPDSGPDSGLRPLAALYELNDPLSEADIAARAWFPAPSPGPYRFLPPAIVAQLLANLRGVPPRQRHWPPSPHGQDQLLSRSQILSDSLLADQPPPPEIPDSDDDLDHGHHHHPPSSL